jgi:Arc/MetJ-type ribon-helix-helix transcriptional regulator
MPVQEQKMERITICIPGKQLEKVDKLVEIGEYPNRSDVVRAAIRGFMPLEGVPA